MHLNYKTLLSCSALIFCFASCITVTEITLKQDGSAHVVFTNGGVSPGKDFYKSDQITDLTWLDDSVNLSFNIKTIDSLGNYLYSDFEKNYFKFKYSNDTLIFTDGNTPTYRYRRYPCWTSSIVITSDQKVKNVQGKYSKRRGNTVIIEKAGRKFKKKKKDTKVVIVFGE